MQHASCSKQNRWHAGRGDPKKACQTNKIPKNSFCTCTCPAQALQAPPPQRVSLVLQLDHVRAEPGRTSPPERRRGAANQRSRRGEEAGSAGAGHSKRREEKLRRSLLLLVAEGGGRGAGTAAAGRREDSTAGGGGGGGRSCKEARSWGVAGSNPGRGRWSWLDEARRWGLGIAEIQERGDQLFLSLWQMC